MTTIKKPSTTNRRQLEVAQALARAVDEFHVRLVLTTKTQKTQETQKTQKTQINTAGTGRAALRAGGVISAHPRNGGRRPPPRRAPAILRQCLNRRGRQERFSLTYQPMLRSCGRLCNPCWGLSAAAASARSVALINALPLAV